jgi:serine protease Do
MGAQKGAIVSDTVPGGPSARGGLQPGDVVVSVNGATVKTSSELTREVAKAKPGDVLKLDVVREGRHRMVEVRSGIRPSERELALNDNTPNGRGENTPSAPQPKAPEVLGMALGTLDEATRRRLNLPTDVHGVVVEGIDRQSDAGQKGLQRGDVIVQAGGKTVNSAADVASAVDVAKKAGRANVLVGVFRNGRTTFLPLKATGAAG